MIKLFSLKQQKKDGDTAPERGKKASAAQLRIQKGKEDNSLLTHLITFSVSGVGQNTIICVLQ